ncbi:MAG: FTR1 family iron permease [Cyanobacteria bacterium REEB459]|nr:FTR1 family iron permease [Cyanobacteria bacterium REEB459]
MDLTTALPTGLITLREGVEAALVVGIVLACLSKAQCQRLYPWVYAGVAGGLAGSAMVGLALGISLQQVQQVLPHLRSVVTPLLNVLFGAIAILMLSWMLLWMTRQARSLRGELEGSVQKALQRGETAGWGIFSLVCIAVLREGFETVLFIFTNVEASLSAALGALMGLAAAALVGIGLFRWGLTINLKQFFQVMGVLLLLIIGGLVISVLKNLDAGLATLSLVGGADGDLCAFQSSCILGPLLWDTSGILPDRQFPGVLLKTLLGYRDHFYLLQAIAYASFWLLVGGSYWRSLRPHPVQKPLPTNPPAI